MSRSLDKNQNISYNYTLYLYEVSLDSQIVSEILSENLSFYEWMNIENILISINEQDLVLIRDISLDELKLCLDNLCEMDSVEKKKLDGEMKYRRILKRSLTSKIKNFLK